MPDSVGSFPPVDGHGPECETSAMAMEEIWQQLAPATRDWLVANNGDAIPADIAAEIDELIDAVDAEDVWAHTPATDVRGLGTDPDDADDLEDEEEDAEARYLSDDAVDWIEERANEE